MPTLLALTLFAVTLPLLISQSVAAGSAFTGKPVIAGYYPSYSGQSADAIPYTSFTHLDFFVAGTADKNWLDWYGASDDLIRSVVTQAHSKKVTVSLCIGGWTGSKYFSRHVKDAGSRQGFADTLKGVVDKFGFDGIDIDWEHIGRSGADGNIVSRDDAANFKRFLPVLRKTLGEKARISISLSVAGMTDENGNTITNYRAYAKYIDYWNVMGYDVFGPWPGAPASGPNAPLYPTCPSALGLPFSLSQGVYLLVHGGVPKSHIVTGLAAYGHAYRTKSSILTPRSINNFTTSLFQPVEGAASQDGMTYSQMIRNGLLSRDGYTGQAGFTRYFDQCTSTPFLFSGSARTLISYDDAESIGIKTTWAKKQGLAGCNFFDTTGDYAPTLPLVNAARKGFGLPYFQESAPNSRVKVASIDSSQAEIDSVPRKGAGAYHAHSVPPSVSSG